MKLNNKLLLVIFSILVLIFVYQKFVKKAPSRSFKDTLLELDTSKIDRMVLNNKGVISELHLKEGQWFVKKENGKSYPSSKTSVNPLLDAAKGIKTGQIVSRSSEKHADYELESGSAKYLEYFKGNKLLGSVYVGRFNFDQAKRTAKSYVREGNDDDIYSVDGFLAMSFDRKPDDFREMRLFTNLSGDQIQSITIAGENDKYQIEKTIDNNWRTDKGMVLDSASITNYVNALASSRGQEFIDSDSLTSTPVASMDIKAADSSHKLNIYMLDKNTFVVSNSGDINQSFRSDSSGLYGTVYLDFIDLIDRK